MTSDGNSIRNSSKGQEGDKQLGDKGLNHRPVGLDKEVCDQSRPKAAQGGNDTAKDVSSESHEQKIARLTEERDASVKKFQERFGNRFNAISKLAPEAKELFHPVHQEMLSLLPPGDSKQVMAQRDFLLAINPLATEKERADSFQALMRNIKMG